MDAGFPGGILTTRPLRFSGNELLLNLHTQGSGGVRVALLDAAGKPIRGFLTGSEAELKPETRSSGNRPWIDVSTAAPSQ